MDLRCSAVRPEAVLVHWEEVSTLIKTLVFLMIIASSHEVVQDSTDIIQVFVIGCLLAVYYIGQLVE